MTAIIRPITALLLSAALMLAANGLEGMLLPLRGAMEGFSPLEIGLLGACYFGGLTFGCVMSPRVILRVGHIRAFLLFAAVATTSPLLEAMTPAPLLWWACRFMTGICFAGIMNVVESWLSSVTTSANRGRVMSIYAMINFGSLTLGQQFTNLSSAGDFRLFSLVAMLCAFAAVPLALTLSAVPTPPIRPQFRLRRMYEVSPAAVAGVLGAGLANGAFWSLAPVYARDSGLAEALAPIFVSLAVLGGALAQWPVGRMSDRFDRRFVLLGLCGGAALTGLLLSRFGGPNPLPTLALGTLFGIFALPVYWVSFAHANDLAEPEEAVNVSASLLLLFSTGATFGPVLASLLKQQHGTGSLFSYTASVHLAVMAFVVLRLLLRKTPLPDAERIAYEDLPISNTPAAFEAALADAHAEERNLELRKRAGAGDVGDTTKP